MEFLPLYHLVLPPNSEGTLIRGEVHTTSWQGVPRYACQSLQPVLQIWNAKKQLAQHCGDLGQADQAKYMKTVALWLGGQSYTNSSGVPDFQAFTV